MLLVFSTGCWEEIRYDPSKYAEKVSERSEPVEVASPVLKPKPPVEEPSAAVEPPSMPAEPTLATLPLTWQLGSQWSMAAALQAKGLGADGWSRAWNDAATAAESLSVELPALPSENGEQDRVAHTVAYLLETAGPELSRQFNTLHDGQHAALVELATKTHVLLLIYSPRSDQMGPIAQAIERAAVAAELPESLWQPLTTLLTDKAPFAEVKKAVFQLHAQVAAHLAAAPAASEASEAP